MLDLFCLGIVQHHKACTATHPQSCHYFDIDLWRMAHTHHFLLFLLDQLRMVYI